jgi:hypothetical protein
MGKGLQNVGGSPASPPYRNGPYKWDQFVTFTGGLAGTLIGSHGHIYFIDEENGSDGNDGLTPETAFATLEKCFGNTAGNLTARDDYDDDAEYHVFVFPGTYAPTLDLRLYGHGIHIHGLGHPGTDSGVNITDTESPTYGLMLLAGANCTIENIEFIMTTDVPAIYALAADNCVIRNCTFKGTHGTTTTAIQLMDVRSTKIYGCQIGEAGGDFTNGIYAEGGADYYLIDSHIAYNRIYSTVSSAKGILMDETSTEYGNVIERNFINLTTGSGSIGIDQNATGGNLIVDNYVMVPASATAIESAATNTGVIGNHTMAGTAVPVDPNEAIS